MPGVVRQSAKLRITADLKLNDRQLRQALEAAWAETNLALVPQFDLEFTRNKWEWPYGKSPRDIKSEEGGLLQGSYVGTPGVNTGSTLVYHHGWGMAYAVPVHEGYRTRSGNLMPARPWTKEPVRKLKGIFRNIARRHLRNVR